LVRRILLQEFVELVEGGVEEDETCALEEEEMKWK
jgi:hypothetical protein